MLLENSFSIQAPVDFKGEPVTPQDFADHTFIRLHCYVLTFANKVVFRQVFLPYLFRLFMAERRNKRRVIVKSSTDQ